MSPESHAFYFTLEAYERADRNESVFNRRCGVFKLIKTVEKCQLMTSPSVCIAEDGRWNCARVILTTGYSGNRNVGWAVCMLQFWLMLAPQFRICPRVACHRERSVAVHFETHERPEKTEGIGINQRYWGWKQMSREGSRFCHRGESATLPSRQPWIHPVHTGGAKPWEASSPPMERIRDAV